MNNYSFVDSINYPNKSFMLRMADFGLLPLRVACNRKDINLQAESGDTGLKTYHVGVRVIAALAVIATLPVTFIALAIKWWKKEEWQSMAAHHSKSIDAGIKEKQVRKDVVLPDQPEKFAEFIQKEFALVQDLHSKLPPPMSGSWRASGHGQGEANQTLANYIDQQSGNVWPDHRPLYIQKMGMFSDIDLKIIAITSDYLQVFHNIPIKFCQTILTMEQLKNDYLEIVDKNRQKVCPTQEEQEKAEAVKRWDEFIKFRFEGSFPRANGQYNASFAIEMMRRVLQPQLNNDSEKKARIIAFTNEDLYTPELSNFVFGVADFTSLGIWSNSRFGDPSSSPEAFQNCLLRMMKISAHEFGHMRGLPHCTDYECNIGGYISLAELDRRPLLYCLQDTAKICYLTQTSLLEQHQKMLDFFQKFNETYTLNCDFTKEIRTLKERIAVLQQ